jgi:hypothetical protein
VYRVCVVKPEGKKLLVGHSHGWEDRILKCVLNTIRVWTGFKWLRVGTKDLFL